MDKNQQPEDRVLFFTSQVDQSSISELTEKIVNINKSDAKLKKIFEMDGSVYEPKPIQIFIDSYGGLVYQCFGLIGVMESSKTPIHTIAVGAAMSCGFIILISGHKRFGLRLCTPMYHQVSSGAWGMLKSIEERLDETKRIQRLIEEITASKTSIKKARLKECFKQKEDWFMTAKEALSLGVIDEIVTDFNDLDVKDD